MDPRFPAGWPFPVPQIPEFIAFRDSGKFFQQFSPDFPGVFLENPRTDPGNSHSLLEFSDQCPTQSGPHVEFRARSVDGVRVPTIVVALLDRER